jgi:uncharacterized membrane protein
MWLVGLLAGGVLGALVNGVQGALSGAVLGWFAGMVFKAFSKKDGAPAPAVPAVAAPANLELRLAAVELRLASLERQLAQPRSAQDLAAPPSGAAVEAVPSMPDPARAAAAPSADAAREIATALPVPRVSAPAIGPMQRTQPLEPPKPNPIVAWLTGGNTIARVGVVILFIGVAFLVKYAADRELFPPELKLASVAAGAIALLVIGWRLRGSRSGYALTLQGAGVGLLYLTVFGAFRLYGFLPGTAAFVLLAAIAALAAVLAVKQDSQALAAFGSAGGFLAPLLASTGGGNHIALFGYFAVLNAAILAMAWFKAWRPLNLLGFLFTGVLAIAWGAHAYRDALFVSCELFLVLFFLFYVAIAVLYASRQAPKLTHYVDGTLIFGNPLLAFGLQASMVHDTEFGLAWSAVALAALYLVLASLLYRRRRDELRLLVESFLAIGVVFATLAIPLALDARWTSAAWALEGFAIVWVGARQGRALARAFGILLQFAGGLFFFDALSLGMAPHAILNGHFVGAVLLALAGLGSSRVIERLGDGATRLERMATPVLFLWGLAWWLAGALREIDLYAAERYRLAAAATLFGATAAVFGILRRRLVWAHALWPVQALLPALVVLACFYLLDERSLLADGGWAAWPFALGVQFALLRRHDDELGPESAAWLHAGSALLLAALGAWELHWLAGTEGLRHNAWSVAAAMLVPALLLAAMSSQAARLRWPVLGHPQAYLLGAALPIAIALWLWTFYANLSHDGQSAPLPYLPLANAIDLGHLLAYGAIAVWALALRDDEIEMPIAAQAWRAALAASVFAWLNGILLRTIHHWADIPYRLDTMLHSVLVQAALSIFWTVLALVLMFTATRQRWRGVWVAGAALMVVVVAKLALVDFSRLGGVERIVSFIGVGVLMLVVGYFAPVPPREAEVA